MRSTSPVGDSVLYATTRQWNPGDEFILAGTRRLLRLCQIDPNIEAIYNKSPEVRSLLQRFNFLKKIRIDQPLSLLEFALNINQYDNSFKDDSDIRSYTAIVFAGSPGWFGGRLASLISKIDGVDEFSGHLFWLGIGMPNRAVRLSDSEKRVMRRGLVVCRNPDLVTVLAKDEISSSYLPCPALLASDFVRSQPSDLRRIALGFSTKNTHKNQAITGNRYEEQLRLFETIIANLSSDQDFGVVVHYIDEIDEAIARYGRDRVVYKYDATDYAGVYASFDHVVSSRVHGCGMSSSVGVPNSILAHDTRGSTAVGFKSTNVDGSTDVARYLADARTNIAASHQALVAHKAETERAYTQLILDYLSSSPFPGPH